MNPLAAVPCAKTRPAAAARARILICDDESSMRETLSRVLIREGYHAVQVADAAAACAELGARSYDLLISDLVMPGMDGMELFRWTRSRRRDTDVILISGAPTLESSLEAFRFGAADYLVKPLDLPSVLNSVGRCLERRRAVHELQDQQGLSETLLRAYRELAAMDGLRDVFERYLTKEVAEKVLANPTVEALRGEKREVSILFADIRRFTPFAESRTPDRTIAALNAVFGRLNAVAARFHGVVAKYTGDGMMVLFGAPLDQPDHALLATRCALEMQAASRALNRERAAAGEEPLFLGVGVNSGEVVAGNLGSEERAEYTVIGAPVNLASRLEEQAQPGQVLAGPATAAAVAGQIRLRSLGEIEVKGLSLPVPVCEALP